MYPTLSFLLGLTTLIPHACSLSIPADPAVGLTNNIIANFSGNNPLPPAPPPWYHIPGTTLSMHLLPPLHPPLSPPLPHSLLTCIAAARASIAHQAAPPPAPLIPRPAWRFSSSNYNLEASAPFPGLGDYAQLSAALGALAHLLTVEGGPGGSGRGGSGRVEWVLSEDEGGVGVVMRGVLEVGLVGGMVGGASAVSRVSGSGVSGVSATATATQSVSIVGVKELVSW